MMIRQLHEKKGVIDLCVGVLPVMQQAIGEILDEISVDESDDVIRRFYPGQMPTHDAGQFSVGGYEII